MSIHDLGSIDATSLDREGPQAYLVVSDHLDWTDEEAHVEALQKKLAAYIAAIESGEIFRLRPAFVGRQIVIKIVGKHPPPADVIAFYAECAEVLAPLDVGLRAGGLEGTPWFESDQAAAPP